MSRSAIIPSLILIIAASLGLLLYFGLGLGVLEASLSGVSAFFVMAFFHLMVEGRRQDGQLDLTAVSEIRANVEALRADMGEFGQGLSQLHANARDRQEMEARMSAELRIVETLIKQLAEVVARSEVQASLPRQHYQQQPHGLSAPHDYDERREPYMEDRMPPQREEGRGYGKHDANHQPAHTPEERQRESFVLPKRAGTGQFDHLSDTEMLRLVRSSVHANRVDLYLQPIVTLPQRKVRYYEALTRLRSAEGEVILPADYMPVAEPAGVMPLIDNILLFRCVQVIKRLSSRNRQAGVFCNISFHSLVDSEFFADFTGYLRQNQDLAGAIIFEFGQATFESLGPGEEESLQMLADMGFRFSLDKVRSLAIDPNRLIERGFKFVKVPADLLMDTSEDLDIHPADLGPLLARHGIDMIVERVETEAMVVDLLDYNISLGQGYLFSAPRPVRAEILGEQGSQG